MHNAHFDLVIDRRNTNSIRWDCMNQYLGLDGTDLLPMWVSDFDFSCPDVVKTALQRRVENGVSATASVVTTTLRRYNSGLPVATGSRLNESGSSLSKGSFQVSRCCRCSLAPVTAW
jgi:hypothetical protein